MTEPAKGTRYTDPRLRANGQTRTFELVSRINPQGTDVAPYWVAVSVDTGRQSVIREDRLNEYRPIDGDA